MATFLTEARGSRDGREGEKNSVATPERTDLPVTTADVIRARDRISSHILVTPLTQSALLSDKVGFEVFLKQENQQHTGSFKPRGALNKILSLSAEERARGIVAASAGNHALGVAYACRMLNLESAHIYVQRNALAAKLAKLARYPVEIHLVGDTFEEAQQAALAHVGRTGSCYISAYDDPAVVAGQGTVGLEITEQLAPYDLVVVPVGGGALLGGIALAVKGALPGVRVIGVNPAASPSALLSLERGKALDPFDHEPTLAHGLAGGFGRTGFLIARALVDQIVLVTEKEIMSAIWTLIDAEQTLAEPSGAAALAAVLFGKVATNPSDKAVVVISGGNIDSGTLLHVLSTVAQGTDVAS